MGGASGDRGRPDAACAKKDWKSPELNMELFAVAVLMAILAALTYLALVRSGDMG
jgi:hypothetical protein